MSTSEFDALQSQARPKLLSLRGRMGRARYIAYSLGGIVLLVMFVFLAALGLQLAGQFGALLYVLICVVLFYCLLPIYFAILTVKRVHDFNFGGWLALLLLVPVVNPLLFWFLPGTDGDNAYGPEPQDEPFFVKLLAVILPTALIGFFLATGGPQVYRPSNQSPTPATSLKPYTP